MKTSKGNVIVHHVENNTLTENEKKEQFNNKFIEIIINEINM